MTTIIETSGQTTVLPPSSVELGSLESNNNAFFLAEQSGLLLTSDLSVDITEPETVTGPNGQPTSSGIIPSGTLVDSFFLHFDPVGNPPGRVVRGSVKLDTAILGVILEDSNLDASDSLLGAPGIAYPTNALDARGSVLEPSFDSVELSEDRQTLTYTLNAGSSTDQLRVITAAAPPVNNPPEITSLSVTPEIDENGTVTLTGTFEEPNLDDLHTVEIDWNDPNDSNPTILELVPGQREFTLMHTYLDDGPAPGNGKPSDPATISVTVNDNSGGVDTDSVETLVENVEPTITSVLPESVFIDDNGIFGDEEGLLVTVEGTFTDLGSLDIHTGDALWSDGVSTELTLDFDGFNGIFTTTRFISEEELENNFPEVGDDSFQLGVTTKIMDDDTGTAQEFLEFFVSA